MKTSIKRRKKRATDADNLYFLTKKKKMKKGKRR